MSSTSSSSPPSTHHRSISARIVADSINQNNQRITTFVVMFPRFILAELNTHRALSRNSASSRARPFKMMLKDVTEDPFIPIKWMATHKGMQGSDYLNEEQSKVAIDKWLRARDAAVASAIEMDALGVTKQLVNRLLEPFMWHEVIITATDYENFFALRAHADAEIHIAALAEAMLAAYNASTPTSLRHDEWHIPFGDQMDKSKLILMMDPNCDTLYIDQFEALKLQVACARCARISYKPFGSESEYDYEADRKLFNALVAGGHWSPLEHCARAMTENEYEEVYRNGRCANFKGFVQYRKTFKNETRKDPRVEAKSWCK